MAARDRGDGAVAAALTAIEAGRTGEAAVMLRSCVARHPRHLAAHLMLGRLMVRLGDRAAAYPPLSRALAIAGSDAVARRQVAPALATLVADLVPTTYDPQLDAELRACFAIEEVDRQSLARVAAQLLLLKHAGPRGDLDAVAADPLWLAFLEGCINVDPAMERRLTALRGVLLRLGADAPLSPAHRRLAWALALQAFAGQYVWPGDAHEAERAAHTSDPALFALYRPLVDFPEELRGAERLARLAIRRTRRDLTDERARAAAMPAIAATGERPVSAAVRRQYEEDPYPRWQVPPNPPALPLGRRLAALSGVDRATLPEDPLSVLIAGCGTGYEAIGVARGDPAATITALDLSRASLAYGQRMADAIGVGSVRFVQGDLLDAAAIEATFDLVYATGVLHHLEDPAAGLRTLVALLRPGGVIRVALYSERARAPIRVARSLIRERGWTASAADIRAFRAHVLAQPASSPLASLAEADDFYSLSGCRDLAFHVQEHQLSLPQVDALIVGAGLRLVGFDAPPGAPVSPGSDPLDLARWDTIEQRDPMLFASMYHCWCQKPG